MRRLLPLIPTLVMAAAAAVPARATTYNAIMENISASTMAITIKTQPPIVLMGTSSYNAAISSVSLFVASNVVIGQNSTTVPLVFLASGAIQINESTGTLPFQINGATLAVRMGQIGVGTALPNAKLEVSSGGVVVSGASGYILTMGSVTATNFSGAAFGLTNIQGANVGSGVPAANIAAGNLGTGVINTNSASGGDLSGSYPSPTFNLGNAHTWTGAVGVSGVNLTVSNGGSIYLSGTGNIAYGNTSPFNHVEFDSTTVSIAGGTGGPTGNLVVMGSVTATGFFGNGAGLTNLAGAPPTGNAGGDLTGTYPNPTLALNKTHTWTLDQKTSGANFTTTNSGSVYVDGSGNLAFGTVNPVNHVEFDSTTVSVAGGTGNGGNLVVMGSATATGLFGSYAQAGLINATMTFRGTGISTYSAVFTSAVWVNSIRYLDGSVSTTAKRGDTALNGGGAGSTVNVAVTSVGDVSTTNSTTWACASGSTTTVTCAASSCYIEVGVNCTLQDSNPSAGNFQMTVLDNAANMCSGDGGGSCFTRYDATTNRQPGAMIAAESGAASGSHSICVSVVMSANTGLCEHMVIVAKAINP